MLKVVGMVFNNAARLSELAFEGDYQDFGEQGTGKVIKFIPEDRIPYFVSQSSNYTFQGNQLVPKKPTDKLHNLKAYDMNHAPVSNKMVLTRCQVRNNEVVGYTVKFGFGEPREFTVEQIVFLSTYFKPENFYVKQRGATKKFYLAAKPGASLDTLPKDIVNIGDAPQRKRLKKAPIQDTGVIKGQTDIAKAQTVGQLDVDIVNLFAVLRETDAYVTTLPTEKYIRTTAATSKTDDAFMPLGTARISSAHLHHSENLMKVTLPFKLPGTVVVPGFTRPLFTYTHKGLAIFKNNSNHINNLGVAIPTDRLNLLMVFLQKSKGLIKVKPLDDTSIKQNVSSLTGKPISDFTFLALNLQGMKLLSDETVKKSILGTEDLAKMLMKFESDKLIIKAIKYKVKELSKVHGTTKTPLPEFAGYSKDIQDVIKETGVDIYSGAFTKSKKIDKDETTDETLSIEYTVCPVQAKTTGESIWVKGTEGSVPYIDTVIAKLKAQEGQLDPITYMTELNKVQSQFEKVGDTVKHLLWLHKVSMLQVTDLKKVHQHDASVWTEGKTRRAGLACYNASTSHGVLVVTLSNSITI